MLQSLGLQGVGHNLETEQQQEDPREFRMEPGTFPVALHSAGMGLFTELGHKWRGSSRTEPQVRSGEGTARGTGDSSLRGPSFPPHAILGGGEWMKDQIPTHALVSVNLRTHSKAGTLASDTGLSFCLPLGKKIPDRDGSSVCRKFCLLHTGAHGLSFTPFYVQRRASWRFYVGFGTQSHEVTGLR